MRQRIQRGDRRPVWRRCVGGARPAADAAELSELFYAAKSPERRLILINLDYALVLPSQPLSALQRTDVWRLESAVLQHNTEASGAGARGACSGFPAAGASHGR